MASTALEVAADVCRAAQDPQYRISRTLRERYLVAAFVLRDLLDAAAVEPPAGVGTERAA